MMTDPKRTPELDRRALVSPPDVPGRDEESWAAITARLDAKELDMRPRRRWVLPTAAIAAAAAALLVVLVPDETPRWAGTTLTVGGEAERVRLEDGSEIVAAPGAELERRNGAADELRLSLRRGAATFEVARDVGRTFIVEVDDVEVRVVGTRFVVRRDDEGSVRVEVRRGAVDVRVGESTRRLRAGQSWQGSSLVEEAIDELVDADTVEEDSGPRRVRRPRTTASEAFDAARTARREGSPQDAAQAYERFLRAYPRDRRAGLAAVELGRLRMDSLDDPAGAAEAFERALRIGPGALREDVMARLVAARRRAGQAAACQRALDAYLARYPEGRHAARLSCD